VAVCIHMHSFYSFSSIPQVAGPTSLHVVLQCAPHLVPCSAVMQTLPCARPQVFFIRDGIQFTDLVHCLRPNPKNNIQEAWRVLDFLSFHPESVNIVSCCQLLAHGSPERVRSKCSSQVAHETNTPPILLHTKPT
jgi:hypothetical protein